MNTCRKSKNCPSGYKCKGNLFGLKKGRCSPKRVKSKKRLFDPKSKKTSLSNPRQKYYKSPKFWFWIFIIILIIVSIGLICWWFFNTTTAKNFCGNVECSPSFTCCPEDGRVGSSCIDPSKEVCCNNVKYEKK